MTASFRKIDYSLRPAKYAERRMLCDIFRRLQPFQCIEDYLYVGFGSVWFSDFSLFHKTLGIKDMVSIEHSDRAALRIEANKPFQITMDFRQSKFALPDLDWTRRQFLWLDYDGTISTDVLLDTATVAANALPGTLLAISVQCVKAPEIAEAERAQTQDNTATDAVERFRQNLGNDRVPPKLYEDDLIGWPYGKICRSVLISEIETVLARRNRNTENSPIKFHPICEFEYEDGAKMTTLVGVFYNDEAKLAECSFDALDFLPPGKRVVRIPVPKLTIREFRQLEKQLPLRAGQALEFGEIPPSEAKNFAQMYRYLPNYAVIEG